MSIRTVSILSLAIAGCAAAVYAVGRRTRQLERLQTKEDLRTWEDEGGNLAPSAASALPRPAAASSAP